MSHLCKPFSEILLHFLNAFPFQALFHKAPEQGIDSIGKHGLNPRPYPGSAAAVTSRNGKGGLSLRVLPTFLCDLQSFYSFSISILYAL